VKSHWGALPPRTHRRPGPQPPQGAARGRHADSPASCQRCPWRQRSRPGASIASPISPVTAVYSSRRAHVAPHTTRAPMWGWSAGGRCRCQAACRWPTMACSSWMNYPSSAAMSWRSCGNRWRMASQEYNLPHVINLRDLLSIANWLLTAST